MQKMYLNRLVAFGLAFGCLANSTLFAQGIDSYSAKKPAASNKSLKMTAVTPMSPLTVRSVNSEEFLISVFIKNVTTKPVVIYPHMTVELFDSDDQVVKKTLAIGRNGFRISNSALEGIHFVTLAKGESHEIKVNLKRYNNDPVFISGWKIRRPGKYQVKLHYKFDRKQVKKDFGRGCLKIEDPDQPWNKAIEMDQKQFVKLIVKSSRKRGE